LIVPTPEDSFQFGLLPLVEV